MIMLREKVVMVMADGCKLTLPDMSLEQVLPCKKKISSYISLSLHQVGRIQMKDVPEDKISLVNPFKGQPVDPKVKWLS